MANTVPALMFVNPGNPATSGCGELTRLMILMESTYHGEQPCAEELEMHTFGIQETDCDLG
jgi:hypothetical protein